jgi:hypothetical protein
MDTLSRRFKSLDRQVLCQFSKRRLSNENSFRNSEPLALLRPFPTILAKNEAPQFQALLKKAQRG